MKDVVTGSLRHSGSVERYHTWPTIRKQTVADHCYHVMRIYYEIFGIPSPEVTTYILFHDSPEVKYGDPPFPSKKDHPELKQVYSKLEKNYYLDMLGFDPESLISDEEKRFVKVCDLLEMWEFGVVERNMGNSYAGAIVVRTLEAAKSIAASFDEKTQWRINNFIGSNII